MKRNGSCDAGTGSSVVCKVQPHPKQRKRRGKRKSPAPVRTLLDGDTWLTLHRATGMAYVRVPVAGKRGKAQVYAGRYANDDGSLCATTFEEAQRIVRESKLLGGPRPGAVTVVEVVERFMAQCVRVEQRGREIDHFRTALDYLNARFGCVPAADFGPLKLIQLQAEMAKSGRWNRKMVNAYVQRVCRCFRWAASRELVPASVYTALGTVEGLRAGRSAVPLRESRKVEPVSDDDVSATLRHVSATIAAMVRVQRLTGMRPAEVCSLTRGSVDDKESVWIARIFAHKNQWRGLSREVAIGPRAQAILQPFMSRVPGAPLFSPSEAEDARRKTRHAARTTPLDQGNLPGSNRVCEPLRAPGATYTTASYARAIARACKAAGVAQWSPNQLRHARATELRRLNGIEAARVVLGHRSSSVTEIYAESDKSAARRAAQETG